MLGVATLGFIIFSGRAADTVIDVSKADRPNDAMSASDGSADKTLASASPDFSLNSSSLRGTEIDGEVLLDPNGRVVLGIGLRRLFDYYLSLVGERDIVQIRAMLKDHLLNKYSPEKPEITIRTRRVQVGIEVTVQDNGLGISKEARKHIFDKFYRVPTGNVHDVKGFGLGLSYVKTIMTAHKGFIDVKSEPGKGSSFILTFPFYVDQRSQPSQEEA